MNHIPPVAHHGGDDDATAAIAERILRAPHGYCFVNFLFILFFGNVLSRKFRNSLKTEQRRNNSKSKGEKKNQSGQMYRAAGLLHGDRPVATAAGV
jgi:hypothetical protein